MKITPIIKVTGMDCNLRCGYCYYENPLRRNTGNIMALSLVQQILYKLAQNNGPGKTVLIWHGGEPMLAGLNFYRDVMDIEQMTEKETGVTFENRIQTNGTLLTSGWVRFFRDNNFRVGISIDGPADIHNVYRKSYGGMATLDKILEGVVLCNQHGLTFGSLAVATNVTVGRGQELFDFFTANGIRSFRVKPCYELHSESGEVLPFSIGPQEYGDLLIDLFNAWIDLDDPKVSCAPVSDYLRGLLGQRPRQCVFTRQCLGYWGIWPSGDVYQCEYFGQEDALLGNIANESCVEILARQETSSLCKGMGLVSSKCPECKWYKICRGGCSRYDVGIGRESNVFCLARKKVFEHISEYLKGGNT